MKLGELASVTFAAADVDALDLEVTSTVEGLIGRKLGRSDPLRLFLRGVELVILQQRLLIDECAKQNLLAYATGRNLEHLGALVGVERLQPTAAVCTMRLTLSIARGVVTIIPAGTRFTAGDEVYFALDTDVIFLAGETEHTASATCTAVGTVGNGYLVGEINQIVDPQAFLSTAVNVTKPEGGADLEQDSAYRERIHEAPEKFSVAGPYGAYRWHAMSTSALIKDVSVRSPEPGVVEVRPLLVDGAIPNDELLEKVRAVLNDRSVRPLTDKVVVLAPSVVKYKLSCQYWINRSQMTVAASIERAAERAVDEYILWQRAELGRDINPSELVHRLHGAGVKRVELFDPQFKVLQPYEVAVPDVVVAAYGGIEED